MSNDLGNNGGSRWPITVGNNVGDDVGDDVGDGDDGGNNAGNNASEGDGGDAVREGGGAPGRGHGGGGSGDGSGSRGCGDCRGGGCILLGLLSFYCEDIFVLYFYVWGELQFHTSPHTLVTLEVCRRTFGWGR